MHYITKRRRKKKNCKLFSSKINEYLASRKYLIHTFVIPQRIIHTKLRVIQNNARNILNKFARTRHYSVHK